MTIDNKKDTTEMKKCMFIFLIAVIVSSVICGDVKSRTDDSPCLGYPYFFKSVSQDGFFHMISPNCGKSQFRDVESGRLISVYEHECLDVEPQILNRYVYSVSIDDSERVNTMYLEDRYGSKHTLYPEDGEKLLFFDDEIIQICEEHDKGDSKIWRKVDDEIVWEYKFPADSKLSWSLERGTQGLQTNDFYRDYIWIFDGEKPGCQTIDPRDGTVCFEISGYEISNLTTNGNIAIFVTIDSGNSKKTIKVLNLETFEYILEEEKDEYFKCYVYGDKATIISGAKPDGVWDEVIHTVSVVGKNDGLEAQYKVNFPAPYTKGYTFLANAKEHILCYVIPTRNRFIIKDARTNSIIWEPDEKIISPAVRFSENVLIIATSELVEALDTKSFSTLWKHHLTNSQDKIAEFDGLEYIRVEDVIKIKDKKFDCFEPYEFDVSDSQGGVEFIPTKYGLIIVPNSKYCSFHEIRLLKPGVDKPVYSNYIQERWIDGWERMDNPDYLRLSTTSDETYMKDIVWFLHIPTGFLSIDRP